MDLDDIQTQLVRLYTDATSSFQKMPGSGILLRYIRSSYQNDPVRSAFELLLFLFVVRYLLSSKYSQNKDKIKLTRRVSICSTRQHGSHAHE